MKVIFQSTRPTKLFRGFGWFGKVFLHNWLKRIKNLCTEYDGKAPVPGILN